MIVKNLLRRILPHAGALLFFYLLSSIYFLPAHSGKEIYKLDIVESHGASTEIDSLAARTGVRSYWTNSIFGGMPAYTIKPDRRNYYFRIVGDDLLRMYHDRPIGYFISMMIPFYLLMLGFGARPGMAAIAAVGFAFSAGNIVIYEVGHLAKLRVISTFGLTTLGFHLAFTKRLWLGVSLFGLGLGLGLYNNHIQMLYYLALVLTLYWIVLGFHFYRESRLTMFLKVSVLLSLSACIGLATSAKHFLPLYEYTKDSNRGERILTRSPGNILRDKVDNVNMPAGPDHDNKKGLSWGQAMEFSFGGKDIASVLIPRAAGGATVERVGSNSKVFRQLLALGQTRGKRDQIPLYHGSLPHCEGTIYMGAVVIFLFVLGLFYLRGPVKWWLISAVILTIVITMGRHMGFINRIWYEYLPLYNKFRSHTMAIHLTAFVVPLLGFYSLSEIYKLQKTDAKIVNYIWKAAAITAGICLTYGVVIAAFMDFSFPGDLSEIKTPQWIEILIADRKSLLRLDMLRSIVFIGLTAGALSLFLKGRINRNVLLGSLAILVIGDLWGIDFRYIYPEKFTDKQSLERQYFSAREADRVIHLDTALHFRVHDITTGAKGSSLPARHHKILGGYNAAKLRRYDDFSSTFLRFGYRPALNMLNAKYFITKNEVSGFDQVIRNPEAMGNAWFVDTILMKDSSDEEFAALAEFDPATQAIVHDEFLNYLTNFRVQRDSGTIELTHYAPNRLVYESNSAADQFAVFSEIWYGPDKGWKVTIDGNPSEHIRANYLLRAMIIPAGNHIIEFRFDPDSVKKGAEITRWSTLFLVLFVMGAIVYSGFSDWGKWITPLQPLTGPQIAGNKKDSGRVTGKSKKGKVWKKKKRSQNN